MTCDMAAVIDDAQLLASGWKQEEIDACKAAQDLSRQQVTQRAYERGWSADQRDLQIAHQDQQVRVEAHDRVHRRMEEDVLAGRGSTAKAHSHEKSDVALFVLAHRKKEGG